MGSLTDILWPKIPPQPDAERDWQAGDRAECIAVSGGWTNIDGGRDVGPDYRQILLVRFVSLEDGTMWLAFPQWPAWYPAGHFRKIRPATDADWLQKVRGKRDLVPA